MKTFREWLINRINEQGSPMNPQIKTNIVADITAEPTKTNQAAEKLLDDPVMNAALKKSRAMRELELAKQQTQPTTSTTTPVASTT